MQQLTKLGHLWTEQSLAVHVRIQSTHAKTLILSPHQSSQLGRCSWKLSGLRSVENREGRAS
jgi:hypothetical protein